MNTEYIKHRIEMLDLAEKLAREDSNPKNYTENMNMMIRCSAGKIELMNMKELLSKAA